MTSDVVKTIQILNDLPLHKTFSAGRNQIQLETILRTADSQSVLPIVGKMLYLVSRQWLEKTPFLKVGFGASLGAQTVKNLPVMQETWVWSLGQEDPLEKGGLSPLDCKEI